MAVVGVGVDLVEIERIDRLLSSSALGARFRRRVFTDRERAYCESATRPAASYAARFVAKEAVMKALCLESGWGFPWPDIEVVRTGRGAPTVVLHGRAARRAGERGAAAVLVSLSHGKDVAIASALAESAGEGVG